MDTAFSKEQFNNIYPPGIENHYWNSSRNKIIFKILKKYGLHTKNILEVGCGTGIVIDYLSNEKNIKITGVEIANIPIPEHLKKKVKTNTNAFELPQNEKDEVEVILLLDVIEHIQHPEEFINEIKKNFGNLKFLLITVPARQEIFSNYDEYNGHFLRYSFKELKKISKKCAVSIKNMRYLFHLLYPMALTLKILNTNRNTKLKPPQGKIVVLHKLLNYYFSNECKLIPRFIFGTSIICLAKVNQI